MRPEIKVYCAPHDASFCRPECAIVATRQFVCLTSAQQALALGYTPCNHCYPAPPESTLGDTRNVNAWRASDWFFSTNFQTSDIRIAADHLGVSAESLEIDTMRRYGLGLREFFRSQKLLMALNLIQDTQMPLDRIVRICGFDSIEEADSAAKTFRLRFGKTLASLDRVESKSTRIPISLRLPYRPPYPWDTMLRFLEKRAIPGVEEVENGAYRRTLALERRNTTYTGWLEVRHLPKDNCLKLTVSYPMLPLLPAIIWRVENLFDMGLEPSMLKDVLRPLLERLPSIDHEAVRMPGSIDGFEMGVRTAIGQQAPAGSASALAGRFARRYGMPIETPFENLTHLFPTPRDFLSAYEMDGPDESIGLDQGCMDTICALAAALLDEKLLLLPYGHIQEEIKAIQDLPGFSKWSAQYLAMRALKYADAFPEEDLKLRDALPDHAPDQIHALTESWKPYRGYAALMLWGGIPSK